MTASTSFDAKNSKWYLIAITALLLGELAVVVGVLMGNPPEFSTNHMSTLIAYAAAASSSILFILAMVKCSVRPIYWLCLALIAFSFAGLASGYSQKLCVISGAAAMLVMAIAFISGDKGDTNSPNRTIRIKIPWG
jgi:hypothetical protein